MNPIDILGDLLGQKAGRSGRAGDILKDILGGGSRTRQPEPAPRSSPGRTSREHTSTDPADLSAQARELEDFLNVARDSRTSPAPRQPQASPEPQRGSWFDRPAPPLGVPRTAPRQDPNDRALLLVRAMLNAAKADGQISPAEQEKILGHLGDASRAAMQFLREELARPLDVREFAWSVPLGMEQEVYMMSVLAIDLDTEGEARYLDELAHALRIGPDARNQIHDRLRAPRPL